MYIFLSLPNSLDKPSSTCGESKHAHLIADLRKKAFSILPLSMLLAVGFCRCPLLSLGNFLLFLVVEYFYQEGCSIQFSRSVVSDPLRPDGLQHPRLPCPSPTPRACSNSCPSSWWCHPTISSSVIPVSSCLQSFPASGSFPMSQLFESGGQSIGASASEGHRIVANALLCIY